MENLKEAKMFVTSASWAFNCTFLINSRHCALKIDLVKASISYTKKFVELNYSKHESADICFYVICLLNNAEYMPFKNILSNCSKPN